jgi:hypothetical protein
VNDERRRILERLFDGEPVELDPGDAGDDPESLAYLRRLSLLRQLALVHDPAAAAPSRQALFVPPRSRQRIRAAILALAASVLFMTFMVHHGRRTGPEPASIPAAPAWPAAGKGVVDARKAGFRSPRPPLEVELYRWANACSPYQEDAAGVALSRAGSLEGRPAAREILVLELANAAPGSAVKLPRAVASQATTTRGLIRKPESSRRHRTSASTRA